MFRTLLFRGNMSCKLTRNLLAIFLSLIPLLASGENRFAGSFMADVRPEVMIYLALTQTQDFIAGAMTIVIKNQKGTVDSRTVPIRGIADGNAITLMAERFLNNLSITGRKKGNSILLTFPDVSEGVATLTFAPASEDDFNVVITQWRQSLLAMYTSRERMIEQELKEHKKLKILANSLYDSVRIITNTGIKEDLTQADHALQDEHYAIAELEKSLAELKHNASLRPMTCYQAYQTVAYDFYQTMGFTFNQNLGYANSEFQSIMNRLEERLSHVDNMVEQIKKQTAELQEAIQVSLFPLPKLPILPGEEQLSLEQYQMLAHSTKDKIPTLKAQNKELVNKASELMREGKSAVETAQSLVRCR